MSQDSRMDEVDLAEMWTLTDDHQCVRLKLPPMPVKGLLDPLVVNIDFEALMLDAIIERLSTLRRQIGLR